MTRNERHEAIREAFARIGSVRGVARELGCDRHTVRAVLGIGRAKRAKRPAQAARPKKIDPFVPLLRRLILEDGLTAILAWEELAQQGFAGKYSAVKLAVRAIRPRKPTKATTVVEHLPGDEGQVDWSPYRVLLGGLETEVHAFSMVLPFSRYMFVRFASNEQVETLIRLHEEGFADLDAVPKLMTYDNMTTVGRRASPTEINLNPTFAAWAKPYEFAVDLTRPHTPNDHAPVERPMHYIEHNCLRRRRFRFDDWDDLNRHAKIWCDTVANVRVHGTTRLRPVNQLKFERSFMLPLPSARPVPFKAYNRTIRSTWVVAHETNTYSVSPSLIGHEATLNVYAERIEVFVDGKLHVTHVRSFEKYQRFALPEHEAEYRRLTPSRVLLEGVFRRLGPVAEAFYDGLVAQRGKGAGHHLKRILSMADRRGNSVVIPAMAHAAEFGNFSADAVARVISGAIEPRKPPTTAAGEAPMPPDRVRLWLEGLEVESRDLGDYDKMLADTEGGRDDEK